MAIEPANSTNNLPLDEFFVIVASSFGQKMNDSGDSTNNENLGGTNILVDVDLEPQIGSKLAKNKPNLTTQQSCDSITSDSEYYYVFFG